jgi:multicomponent Na+:H+ antiporter subunit F
VVGVAGVNAFSVAAVALLLGLVPCGIVCLRGRVIEAVVALELAGSVTVTLLICLAEAFHKSSYFNLPVICAFSVWVSGLVFARFLGRVVP